MARYRFKSEGYIDRPFKLISVLVTEVVGGEDVEREVRRRDPDVFSCMVPAGAVVEVEDDFPIGEHMEPVDEKAKAAHAKYVKPAHWNNLDSLPNTIDMREPEDRMADALARTLAAMGLAMQGAQKEPEATHKLSLKPR